MNMILPSRYNSSAHAARWHSHVNALQASAQLESWLTHRDSLTARLIACSQHFRVQRLRQARAICLADEYAVLGLARQQKVVEREVLLRCDDVAVVYAHTVMPLTATATQWPLFASLGEKSLGSTLFSDPLVQRGALHFARLRPSHPLMTRIRHAGAMSQEDEKFSCLFARRSIFMRKGARLLVTEVFLPHITQLMCG